MHGEELSISLVHFITEMEIKPIIGNKALCLLLGLLSSKPFWQVLI